MKTCCRECGVVLELRTFGYGEIDTECPICGAYLEYQERSNETETNKKTNNKKGIKTWGI